MAEVLEANGLTISDLVEVLETLGTELPAAPFGPLVPQGGDDRFLDSGPPVVDAVTPTVTFDEPPLSTPGAAPDDSVPTPPGVEDDDEPPAPLDPPKSPLPPPPPPPPTLAPLPTLPPPTLAPLPTLPPPTLAPPGDHEHDDALFDLDQPVLDLPPLL